MPEQLEQYFLVDEHGEFVEGTSENVRSALLEVVLVLNADDGGEDISGHTLRQISTRSLESQGVEPDERLANQLVFTARAIKTWGTRPSPF